MAEKLYVVQSILFTSNVMVEFHYTVCIVKLDNKDKQEIVNLLALLAVAAGGV